MRPPAPSSRADRRCRSRPRTSISACQSWRVWRHWGRGKKRRAVLRDVDLELAPGSAMYISGRNGAGKTHVAEDRHGHPRSGQWRGRESTASGSSRTGASTTSGSGSLRGRPRPVRAFERAWPSRALGRAGVRPVARNARRWWRKRWCASVWRSVGAPRRPPVSGAAPAPAARSRPLHRPKVLLLDEPRNSLDAEGLEIVVSGVDDVVRRGRRGHLLRAVGEPPAGSVRSHAVHRGRDVEVRMSAASGYVDGVARDDQARRDDLRELPVPAS